MRRIALLSLPLLLTVGVSCGSGEDSPATATVSSTTTPSTTAPTSTAPAAECSTSTIRLPVEDQEGLSEAVAVTRKAIVGAALACDYDALEQLTSDAFSFSFGAPAGGPADYWRAREADGEPVMKILAQLMNLPHVDRQLPDGGKRYVSWPSADQEVRTQADWDALKGLYPDEEVAAFQQSGLYTGYRSAIDDGGEWMYFVAGD